MSPQLNFNQRNTLQLLVNAGGQAALIRLGNLSRGDCTYLQNNGLIEVPRISKGRWIKISEKGKQALGATPEVNQVELAPDARFSIVTRDGVNGFEADKYVEVKPTGGEGTVDVSHQALLIPKVEPVKQPQPSISPVGAVTPPFLSKEAEARAKLMARSLAPVTAQALGHMPQDEQQEIVSGEVQRQIASLPKHLQPLDPNAKSASPKDVPVFGSGARLTSDLFDPFLLSKPVPNKP